MNSRKKLTRILSVTRFWDFRMLTLRDKSSMKKPKRMKHNDLNITDILNIITKSTKDFHISYCLLDWNLTKM